MSKPKFPVTVKRGHTIVNIYRTPSRGCDAYMVSYYLGDQRVRKTFADLGLATTEAETVENKLSTDEVNIPSFRPETKSRLADHVLAGLHHFFPSAFVPQRFTLMPRAAAIEAFVSRHSSAD